MAPFSAIWMRVVYIFDILSGSRPFPSLISSISSQELMQTPLRPIKIETPKYPVFDPPDELEPVPFRCEYPSYPEEDGWVACNSNSDRRCWLKNTITIQTFDITTDYETTGPKGIVREYYLELTNSYHNADGNASVPVQLFNGSFPGPRLQACWGDQVRVTIKNLLHANETTGDPGNGTTVHWHGFRMLNSGHMDGVNAVTQCPIPPGENFTYVFNVTQYGTSWYHSHYSLQYGAGLFAPFTVYGPVSHDFDHQLYPIIISDWVHESVFTKWERTVSHGGRIYIDNILQNGIGHWPPMNDTDQRTPSTRFNEVFFQEGVRYLIRLINGASDTTFIFSIDHHKFWVVSMDFVSIEPYETNHVVIGIGQRYNIIVKATPDTYPNVENYWMRTIPAYRCTAFTPTAPDEFTGIVRYTRNDRLPLTASNDFNNSCAEETYLQHRKPIVKWTIPDNESQIYSADVLNLDIHRGKGPAGHPYYPCTKDPPPTRFELITKYPTWLNFSDPIMRDPAQDFAAKPWLTVVDLRTEVSQEWIKLTIISGPAGLRTPLIPHPLPNSTDAFVPAQHPIHLHGHDFAILDQCVPTNNDPDNDDCNALFANLTLDNPPRRDTAFLPDNGYLIIAFKADNPGAWIMHCHIAFHASMGLAVNFLENTDRWDHALGPAWKQELDDVCVKWDAYARTAGFKSADPCNNILQTDSGI